MARVLVTGAAGFLGRATVRLLRERGHEVRATTLHPRDGCEGLDVGDALACDRALAIDPCDAVVHLAANRTFRFDEMDSAARVNTLGAANLLAAAARRAGRGEDPPAVVLVGTSEEYGRSTELPYSEEGPTLPISPYGTTKQAATRLALAVAPLVPTVVLRPSVIYGPGQPEHMLVVSVARAALRGEPSRIHGGEQTRDLVYVDDVADALERAIHAARGVARGRVINVGSGVEVTVREIAERVIHAVGAGRVDVGPSSSRIGDTSRIVLDVARAHALLGWRAQTSLDEGLAKTVAALRPAR